VTRDVLVPRPETETLASLAIDRARALGDGPLRILDFGTGSGCLAIALASRLPAAMVDAIDISPAALEVARDNATRAGVADRIRFLEGDGFAALPTGESGGDREDGGIDLIVSNPQYIPTAVITGLDPEVRDHDPRMALDGGEDGLDFYRRLAAEASGRLRPRGWLLAEFGDGQGPAIRDLMTGAGWGPSRLEKDLSGRERVIIAAIPAPGQPEGSRGMTHPRQSGRCRRPSPWTVS
jgi:release factor glutamine methyltransferase